MAESKPIKSNEIIQDDVFANATKSAKELESELSKLIVGFEGIIKVNAEFLKTNKDPQTAVQVREVSKAIAEQEKARKSLLQAEIAAERLKQAAIKVEKEQLDLLKKQQAETNRQAKELEKLNSEYKKGVQRLSEIKKEMKDLAFEGKQATDRFKQLSKEFTELDGKVRLAEESVGEFHRNVGNYKSGFNGLGNSINQLTREFPAFTNSVQTGFMAISNNLPIFFDEISRVRKEIVAMRAEGQKVPGLFSQLATSVFSWGTALSLGITLLTLYSKELFNAAKGLFNLGDAFKYSTDLMQENSDFANDIVKGYKNAVIDLKEAKNEISKEAADILRNEAIRSEKIKQLDELTKKKRLEVAKAFNKELKDILEEGKVPEVLAASQYQTPETQREVIKGQESLNAQIRKINKEHNDLLILINAQFDKKNAANKIDVEKKKDNDLIKEAERLQYELQKLTAESEEEKLLIEFESERIRFKRLYETGLKTKEDKAALDQALIDLELKYQQKLNEIKEKQAEKERQALERTKKDIEENAQWVKEQEAKEAEEKRQKEIKHTQENIQMAQWVTQAYSNELNKRVQLQEQQLDMEINNRRDAVSRQVELAKAGLDNQLAYEQMKLEKDQLKKKELQEKAAKQQEIIQLTQAYMNAYNAELQKAGTNPSQAAAKAFGDVLLAKGIAKGLVQFFAEGTDYVDGPGTETSDSIPAMLSKGEAVIPAKHNKQNRDAVKALVDGSFQDMYLPKYELGQKGGLAENITNNIVIQQNNEITKLLKDIAKKPVQQVDVDGLKNIIETVYYEGRKEVIMHKAKTRL